MLMLKPSKISDAGVGIFTTKPIKKGTVVPLFADGGGRLVKRLDDEDAFFVRRFALQTDEGWWCPRNWHRMSIGWYINHMDIPNVVPDDYGSFHANRYIRSGEEIYINYTDLG